MTFRNTSMYSTAVLKAIWRFVVVDRDASGLCSSLAITNYSKAFRGRCKWDGEILVRLGGPQHFPFKRHRYREGAPEYSLADWQETAVIIFAHELHHARIFMANRREMGNWPYGKNPNAGPYDTVKIRRRRHSETDCERAAYACLESFRATRESLGLEDIANEEQGAVVEKMQAAAARRSPEARRSERLAKLGTLVKTWTKKRKLAETKLKKYTRALRRLEKEKEG